ncbi:unnamed protein product [Rotaria sp. Silwood2]|nr:unnamed protein product [Rotaria sp. Silwood2]CAF4169740.1 unnamed protein product [Rotaria sp. Silwood2]
MAMVDGSDEEELMSDKENKTCSSPAVTLKLSWSIEQIREALLESPFANISMEILIQIFRLLSVPDLKNVALVCRSFNLIVDDDEIWRLKCNRSHRLYSKSFKEIYMDWMHEKYLHNQELKNKENAYGPRETNYLSFDYSLESTDDIQLPSRAGFDEHPDSSEDMIIELSVDIDRTAPELISLLEKACDVEVDWRRPEIIRQMIMRYYRFMQLKASFPADIFLVPTLDIEIVWQTHLLRPNMYQKDCLRLFHRVIEHSLLINDIEQYLKEQAFLETCQLYEERFDEQYCPLLIDKEKRKDTLKYHRSLFRSCLAPNYSYWDQTYFLFGSESPKDYENSFSFTENDIILDYDWLDSCKEFMYNCVSNQDYSPPYKIDLGYLPMQLLKKSYERFLYIINKYSSIEGYQYMHPTHAVSSQ